MNLLELPLTSIEVGRDRARELDAAWADALAAMIAQQGLMQPVVVCQADDGYRLVAGLHRLEATRLLGRTTINATVVEMDSDDTAKLAEVMENLGRYDLIALDRCHHLYELKQIWERKYPQSAHGKASSKSQSFALSSDSLEIFGFARAVADKIGLSASSIKAAVKIWTGLAPQSRQRLRGTDLAHKQTELRALSDLPTPRKQCEVLDAVENPDLPEVSNVAQALAYLSGGVREVAAEKQFQTVRSAFAKLSDQTFDMVVSAEADRVIASLKRLGRI